MRTIFWVAAGHVVGVALLIGVGFALNSTIHQYAEDYAGLITVFSTAFGVYAFIVNLLYHKNRAFHLWVNRILLVLTRTHTYWQPSFDFDLRQESSHDCSVLVQEVLGVLREPEFGNTTISQPSLNTATVCFDELMCFVLRVEDLHLHIHLDRKLLVPSHLYEKYSHRLARIAEAVQHVVQPTAVRCGMTISFGDGVKNPYYGFFVSSVPADLLHTFQVSFRLDQRTSCRVEAGTDQVTIEGKSLVDLFAALSQVLNLRATPGR